MKKTLTFLSSLLLITNVSLAKTEIKSLNFEKISADKANVKIQMNGEMQETPELTIKDNIVQIVVPSSFVWPKIEKKVTVSNNFDTTLMAYQFNKELVRVRAILPYSLKGKEDQVSLTLNDDSVVLSLPTIMAKAKSNAVVSKTTLNTNSNKVEKFDESYLEKLIKDKEVKKIAKAANNEATKVENKAISKDVVSTKMSSTIPFAKETKETKSEPFSLMSYISKIVAFLALIILGFYAVMNLMRKGVLKKGKLGFLNDTKLVEVLNTTYIAPKRSVMMIKAHNQVFLVGSTEQGLQALGEINDVTGLIKQGEKEIAGDNFDTNLGLAEHSQKDFKLKEVQAPVSEEEQGEGLANFLQNNPVGDQVKLSDQIKSKVKGLKSFQ